VNCAFSDRAALQLLYKLGRVASLKEIADLLNWEEEYAGATLTNLMKKKHWPVPLVDRPSEGKYLISGHGFILMKKYEELYGVREPGEKSEPEKKTELEDFLKK